MKNTIFRPLSKHDHYQWIERKIHACVSVYNDDRVIKSVMVTDLKTDNIIREEEIPPIWIQKLH